MKYRVQSTVHSFRVSVAVLDSLSPLQIRFQSTNQREGGRGKGSGKERGEIGIRRGEKGRTKGGGEGMDTLVDRGRFGGVRVYVYVCVCLCVCVCMWCTCVCVCLCVFVCVCVCV